MVFSFAVDWQSLVPLAAGPLGRRIGENGPMLMSLARPAPNFRRKQPKLPVRVRPKPAPKTTDKEKKKEKEITVRTEFPETWLWMEDKTEYVKVSCNNLIELLFPSTHKSEISRKVSFTCFEYLDYLLAMSAISDTLYKGTVGGSIIC